MSWLEAIFLAVALLAILQSCTSRICKWLRLIQSQLANSTDYVTEKCQRQLGELTDRVMAAREQWEGFYERPIPPHFVQLDFNEATKLRDALWILDNVRDKAIKRATAVAEHHDKVVSGQSPPKEEETK